MKNNVKKIFVLLLAGVMFMTCSCQLSFKKIPKIPSMNFTVNADVSYKSYNSMTCEITNEEDGPLTIEIKKPVVLSGLIIECQGENCTIKYGSLSYDADTQKYPQLTFGKIMNEAIESAKEEPDFTQNDDGTWTLHTTANNTDVWITLDKETYYPLTLKVPSEELEISFSNFRETEKTE